MLQFRRGDGGSLGHGMPDGHVSRRTEQVKKGIGEQNNRKKHTNQRPRMLRTSLAVGDYPGSHLWWLLTILSRRGAPKGCFQESVFRGGEEGTGARGAPVPKVGLEVKFKHVEFRSPESHPHEGRMNSS